MTVTPLEYGNVLFYGRASGQFDGSLLNKGPLGFSYFRAFFCAPILPVNQYEDTFITTYICLGIL